MAESRKIARILGPTLVMLTASELANPQIWTGVAVTQIYLAGALWFVAGLSIVCAHNRWSGSWPLLVTLVGWFAIVGGAFRMLAPEVAQRSVPAPTVLLVAQAMLLAVGAFISYKGFQRADR